MERIDIVSAIRQMENNCKKINKEMAYYTEVMDKNSQSLQLDQDCVTLITVTGLAEVEFDGKAHTLTPNNVLLIKNGMLRFVRSLGEDSKVCILHIPNYAKDDYLKSQMSDCPIFYDFLRLQANKMEYLLFDITFEPMVQTYLQIIFYEATQTMSDEAKKSKNVRCALILFLTNLHYNYQKSLIISESTMMEDYEIGRILKYVADHYATVTLSSVAKEFNFHPAYFSSRFKKLA